MWLLVAIFASVCVTLSFVLLLAIICYCRRRRDEDVPEDSPLTPSKYRPTRKSRALYIETIDEDFTIPPRRLRATPPSASFREVASGLGVANLAMEQLSRVGQQQSKAAQARSTRQNLKPSSDNLVFDDFLENVKSFEDLSGSTDSQQ